MATITQLPSKKWQAKIRRKGLIIASIANYFKQHHWQYHRPSAYWLPIGVKLNRKWKRIAAGKLKHWVKLAELRKSMPKVFNAVPLPWQDDDKVSVIEMKTKLGKQLALVHYNFHVGSWVLITPWR